MNLNISVVIPAFNQSLYLKATIDSVLRQTYPSGDIIVVDDGSTDNTPQIAREYGNAIRVIRQKNQGLASARNTGILNAQGNFVAFLDSDDLWMPEYLETMIDFINNFDNVAVCYSGAKFIDANGNELPQNTNISAKNDMELYYSLLRTNFINASAVLVRRDVLIDAGLFDQWTPELRFGLEDWDLWLRLAKNYSFVCLPQYLTYYRLHEKNMSANPIGMQKAMFAVVNKYYGEDDGKYEQWSKEKRYAYGSAYLNIATLFVLRSSDWETCAQLFYRALKGEPSFSTDLNFFYELALGNQSLGYRGTKANLNLLKNADSIQDLLRNPVFKLIEKSVINRAFETSNHAIAKTAYNTGNNKLCRRYLLRIIIHSPRSLYTSDIIVALLKTFLRPSIRKIIRKFSC